MKELIIWILVFVLIYLTYLFFVILRKKKFEKFKNNMYVNYLIRVYSLNKKKLNYKSLAHIIALANAFIIATTFIIIGFVDNLIIMLLASVIILIPLQLFVYHIIGKSLKRGEKNV